MSKNEKSMKILGAIALASTALFVFKSRENPDNTKIEGLNIDIDPEKMIDNVKSNISPYPKVNEAIANAVKLKISKMLK